LFKEKVQNSELTAELKAKVIELFTNAHAHAQDKATKDIVKELTVKPTQ
jgi:anti-sigma regulatory factor (Ser/Thr protein kinase)